MFENPIDTNHKTRRVDIHKRTIRGNKSHNKSLQKKCAFLLVLIATLLIGCGVYFYLEILKNRQHLPNQESNIVGKPSSSEPNDKQPAEPTESVTIKAKDTFFHLQGEFNQFKSGVYIIFKDIEQTYYMKYIIIKKESFILIDSNLVPQNLSEKKKQEYLSNQHLEQTKCPSPYEKYLCVLRTYEGMTLTHLVGTLDLSDDKILNSQKIPIVSEIVLKNRLIKGGLY